MPLTLSVGSRRWPLHVPFVISRETITQVATLDVVVHDRDGVIGRGSATGLDYAGETIASMQRQVEQVRSAMEEGADRHRLLHLLPPGGARAALDAALWDREAKRGGPSPFVANGSQPDPVQSAGTIGLCAPPAMESAARAAAATPVLKLKVGRDDPVAVVAAARRGAPDARFIVDPNQAWTLAHLHNFAAPLAALGVVLLEQPTAVGTEADLDGYRGPIPLCADESCGSERDLDALVGRFGAINIKLDKTGGLTAALALADAAVARGLGLMVGCMLGPSSTVAPAMVLAQRCAWVDLDAPPFLTRDEDGGFLFDNGLVRRPHLPALWG